MATFTSQGFEQDSGISRSNDETSKSDRHIQTPHIRACQNCVRAKAKCAVGLDPKGKCQRCQNMNKECQPSPPMRKRRTVKRPPQSSANKTAKLEEKLDGLVTLLKSATQGQPGIINATSLGSSPDGFVQLSHGHAPGLTATNGVGYQDYTFDRVSANGNILPDSAFTPATTTSLASTPPTLQHLIHPTLEPSPEEAESSLHRFQTDFVKHLPFLVIPPTMTADLLRQDRPILWVCIMAAASCNSTQQIALSKEIRGILGRQAYVEGTRNMDLLLAILVYAAWGRRHSVEKPIVISLVQLAIAVLYDLRLDRPTSKDPALILVYELKGIGKPSRLSRPPTMEERRALLGCFLISSITSSALRKGGTLRWTAYSDECLRVIETEKEFASDLLLVQLVKLRLISERVVNAPLAGSTVEVDSKYNFRGPPAMFYLKSLESQLQDFKSNIPPELTDNKTLLMELYNAELTIHEIGFSLAPGIFTGPYNRRLECLFACLSTTKSLVETFLTIPPAQYVGFSNSIYMNMMGCFTVIYRLSTFEDPEWDRSFVKETIDVSFFLDQVEKNFTGMKVGGLDHGGSDDVDFFSILASRVRFIKKVWCLADVSTMAPLGVAPVDNMGDFPMEPLDDDWLGDLFGPWKNQ